MSDKLIISHIPFIYRLMTVKLLLYSDRLSLITALLPECDR
ncbi:hypothetical protein [Trichormus variabilis]|nr:hypothetical protein [Trichormus variabilis]